MFVPSVNVCFPQVPEMYALVLLFRGDEETLPLINQCPSLCYKVAEKVPCMYLLWPATVPLPWWWHRALQNCQSGFTDNSSVAYFRSHVDNSYITLILFVSVCLQCTRCAVLHSWCLLQPSGGELPFGVGATASLHQTSKWCSVALSGLQSCAQSSILGIHGQFLLLKRTWICSWFQTII